MHCFNEFRLQIKANLTIGLIPFYLGNPTIISTKFCLEIEGDLTIVSVLFYLGDLTVVSMTFCLKLNQI